MATYKIYHRQKGEYRAVKQGFSWPAFFFTWLWAFVKGLWEIGIIGLLLYSCSGAFADGVTARNDIGPMFVFLLLIITYLIIFGVFGNRWYMKSLTQRGFEYIDTVTTENSEAAMMQIADRNEN